MRSGCSPARPCAVARDGRHAPGISPGEQRDRPIGGHVLDRQHPVLEPEIAHDGTRTELTHPVPQERCQLCETGTTVAVHHVADLRQLRNPGRASPRGPRSWQECGARLSSYARPAIARSTPTRSRTGINRWRARCGESRTRRKPVNQTTRPKTGTTISNKSPPGSESSSLR